MTVLSGQSIRKRLGTMDIEIYTKDNKGYHMVPDSHMKGHTVDLSLGRYVAELSRVKLQENLKDVFYLDRMDYLGYAGLNPEKDREAIEKSSMILDLLKLDDYIVENEGQGDKKCYSYIVRTKDKMHTFATRITKEKPGDSEASGIIYHPDSYHLKQDMVMMKEISMCIADNLKIVNSCIKKKNSTANLEKLGMGLDTLYRKLRNPIHTSPSTSFNIGWTYECVKVPQDLVAYVHTKSKFARLGLSTNMTSDKIDPGFCNNIALEFKNEGPYPIQINLGQPVAEIEFVKLDRPEAEGYNERKGSIYKKDKLTF